MIQRKKIAIIGTVGVPANYGGFETLAEHLIEDLGADHDLTVYCSGKKYKKEQRKKTYKGARLKFIPLEANGIQSIPYDTWSIIHALFRSDVLLILGVAGAWMLPFVRLFTKKKIIISIDGIEWKRDKWNPIAKLYLFWAEGLAVKYSHIDISDNEAIQDYTAARYGTLSKIIEYGADHTLKVPISEESIKRYPFLSNPYAFKVCRIEPENNVQLIIEAFTKVSVMPLVLVGNWKNSVYSSELKQRYEHEPNVHLLDPIYDQEKLDELRSNAALYVHGHSAGGTNPSLVEAMFLGLPILAYGVSYNQVTTEYKALYFNDQEELIEQLGKIYSAKLSDVGSKMKEIADRRYCWPKVAEKYKALVEEVMQVEKKTSVLPAWSQMRYSDLLEKEVSHLKTSQSF